MSILKRFYNQGYEIALLAPSSSDPSPVFANTQQLSAHHRALLKQAQALRGASYLERGIIHRTDLDADRGYPTGLDGISWHLMVLKDGRPVGFTKYRLYTAPDDLENLRTTESLARLPPEQQVYFRSVVEGFVARALTGSPFFGEASSLVSAGKGCATLVGVFLLLCSWAFYHLHGHGPVLATTRIDGGASALMMRMGGSPLTCPSGELPAYYDPFYRSSLRILSFDSRWLASGFRDDYSMILRHLSQVTVYRN